MLLAAGLHQDPLISLSAPPYSLAVAGRRCGNKGRRKRRKEEGKGKKRKGSCTPTKFFMSISPVRPLSLQFALRIAPNAMGVNVSSVIDHLTQPAIIPIPVAYPYDCH